METRNGSLATRSVVQLPLESSPMMLLLRALTLMLPKIWQFWLVLPAMMLLRSDRSACLT